MGIRDRISAARAGSTGADGTATPGDGTDEDSTAEDSGSTRSTRTLRRVKGERAARERGDLTLWRTRASQLLWTAFVLLALVLAVAALLVAIDANEENGLVDFFLGAADAVDLGVFSRENGIREFTGDNAETKNALFNWGLGAVAYLLVGRLVERLVRPGS